MQMSAGGRCLYRVCVGACMCLHVRAYHLRFVKLIFQTEMRMYVG